MVHSEKLITWGSREEPLPENDFKTSSTVNSTKCPDFGGLETIQRLEIQV